MSLKQNFAVIGLIVQKGSTGKGILTDIGTFMNRKKLSPVQLLDVSFMANVPSLELINFGTICGSMILTLYPNATILGAIWSPWPWIFYRYTGFTTSTTSTTISIFKDHRLSTGYEYTCC